MLTTITETTRDQTETTAPNWAADAPRGGRTVMNRILQENATVPLFFAQTLIASLRDVGYNSTTSALCEHVDNAIEAGAREIRIYFRQRGVNGRYDIDAAVYDGGRGMTPNGSGGNCMGMAMMILQRPQGATSGGSVSHHHWHGGAIRFAAYLAEDRSAILRTSLDAAITPQAPEPLWSGVQRRFPVTTSQTTPLPQLEQHDPACVRLGENR